MNISPKPGPIVYMRSWQSFSNRRWQFLNPRSVLEPMKAWKSRPRAPTTRSKSSRRLARILSPWQPVQPGGACATAD